MEKNHVYCKLDWFSIMLSDCSIYDVFNRLDIPCDFMTEIIDNGFKRDDGLSVSYIFAFYGISIQLRLDDYLVVEREHLYHTKFKKIRLDISSTGLDYLRSFSVPDIDFTKQEYWNYFTSYNVTRVDYAFDFINYKSDILDNMLDFIFNEEKNGYLQLRDSRLKLGVKGGMKYSYRCGSGLKTLYIGTGRSSTLLRIYDKYLECIDENGIWKRPDERFNNIIVNNWIRFELQTRRDEAQILLFSCNNNIRDILRYIFDKFVIRDDKNRPLDFIMDFYKWEDLPPIILVSDFIQFNETVDVKVTDYVEGRSLINIVLYYLLYGNKFKDNINKKLISLQNPKSNTEQLRYNAFLHKLALLCEVTGKRVDELDGIDSEFYKLKHIIKIK